ncbi:MAG: mechanosensitive ion channel family protein [archaeon]|jgi:MscS family membrane protein
MILDFFTQTFLGNSTLQYAYFLCAIAVSVIIGKTISWLFSNTLTNLAKNTQTTLDDFLVMALRRPITVIITLVGIYFSFNLLTLDANATTWINQAFYVALTVFLAWFATKIADSFFEKILKPAAQKTDSKLDDHILPIVSKAVKVIIWVIAGITILSNFGYDVTAILAGLGIGGLAFAFAAQKTIADVFGGISILFSKPFIVGDTIEIKSLNLIGDVVEIGLRNTRIKDPDGRINTIPNSDLSASVVKNISSEPEKRILTNLGLTYNTSSKQLVKAKELLAKIISSNKGCNNKKEPVIYFNDFQASAINIQVIYYISDKKNWQKVQDSVNMEIKEQFEKNKIDFAYPTQTIILKK